MDWLLIGCGIFILSIIGIIIWVIVDIEKNERDVTWFPAHNLKTLPDSNINKFILREFNKKTYMLENIPEEGGLWGTYCGQGDLQWAWVRLDIWKKWARPEIVREFEIFSSGKTY